MARRRELNGIAAGLLGSFFGRNNDDGGYWAMGKLYSFAAERGQRTVVLDLQEAGTVREASLIARMASNYCNLLQEQCRKFAIPPQWVASATIIVTFEISENETCLNSKWPDSADFAVEVVITDDLGRCHRAQGASHCAQHDPTRETRSPRAEKSGDLFRTP